jgi:carboxylesterase type B
VQTTSGPVDGHAASVASGVSEYLGVPYAQPPVGSLRFQPPVRYNGTGKIDGKNFVRFISNTTLLPASDSPCFTPLSLAHYLLR